MLLKSLAAATLISLPLLAASSAGTVVGGSWEDGTTILWACGTERLQLPIQITTADGKVYEAVLVCNPV